MPRSALWLAMAAVAVVGVLAAAPGSWVRSTYGAVTSADEPHYLLTAISLGEDGDLNVDDELDTERWREFHEARLPQQSAETEDGRRVSPHDPLLPALLALPMRLGGWLGARLALALVAGALAAATLWVAVRRFGVALSIATVTVGVAAASAPLFVYGSQVYPELPAALAVVVAVGAGLGPVRARSSAVVALAVVTLPWLAVKYVPVAAAVALLHLVRVARSDRGHAAGLVGVYAAAGLAYVVAHLAWYGGVTVYAAGEFFREHGGQQAVFGTRPNIPGRAVRLVGLLVDRTFGIAAWQPAWLAVVPAGAVLARRRPPDWLWLAVPAGVGWLNATFVAVTMHGWWFPGRQVVVVLPLLVIGVTWWLGRTGPAAAVAVALAAALGLWSSAALIVDGLQQDIVWIVDFFEVQASPYRLWRPVLPDYHDPTAATWWLHAGWLLAIGAAAFAAWRGSERAAPGPGLASGVRRARLPGRATPLSHPSNPVEDAVSYDKIQVPDSGERITVNDDGTLSVPDEPIVCFIEGDGTGPDIWAATVRVLDAAVEKAYGGDRRISWMEVYAGDKANDVYGEVVWLPDETLDAFDEFKVGIKGPLTTPVGGGIRSINVAIRQKMDLYACVRPVRWFQGVPSPIKDPSAVDMVIFRENTEDIYAGIEYAAGTPEVKKLRDFLMNEMGVTNIRFPETSGLGIKPVSEEGTKRLVRAAIEYALEYDRKSVALVHKGNIMKFTEGAFRDWGYELAEEEYGDRVYTWSQYDRTVEARGKDAANEEQAEAEKAGKIIVKDVIADAMLQQILTRPAEYDVIATMNLNGDYISDALAAEVGGIGIAPGANINYDTGHAVFEATHGTAPKYAGQDKVNPSSLILSGEMMLRHLGWPEAAQRIVDSMEKTISAKRVTYDFERLMDGATKLKTSEFGDALIENM